MVTMSLRAHRQRCGLRGVLLLSLLLCCLVTAQAASADPFSWSKATRLDAAAFTAVVCPSSSECVAVDQAGNVVAVDPITRTVIAHPTAVDAGRSLVDVACPSVSQCTAVDGGGREVTFDPMSGHVGAPGIKAIDAADGLVAVSCSSTSQCTAAGGTSETTFDPTTGVANATGTKLLYTGRNPDDHFARLKCVSAGQCTGATTGNAAYTFDPRTGRLNAAGAVGVSSGSASLEALGLACPSASQCTTVDGEGAEGSFNPVTGKRLAGTELGGPSGIGFEAISCPTSTRCTAMNGSGEVTFNPQSPPKSSSNPEAPGPKITQIISGGDLVALACPSTLLCVAVDSHGNEIIGNVEPAVTTLKARSVTRTTAVLNGRISTFGVPVAWQFQFGSSKRYHSGSPVKLAGPGRGTVQVHLKLTGLRPDTRYHFRLVSVSGQNAVRSLQVEAGLDMSFMTRKH